MPRSDRPQPTARPRVVPAERSRVASARQAGRPPCRHAGRPREAQGRAASSSGSPRPERTFDAGHVNRVVDLLVPQELSPGGVRRAAQILRRPLSIVVPAPSPLSVAFPEERHVPIAVAKDDHDSSETASPTTSCGASSSGSQPALRTSAGVRPSRGDRGRSRQRRLPNSLKLPRSRAKTWTRKWRRPATSSGAARYPSAYRRSEASDVPASAARRGYPRTAHRLGISSVGMGEASKARKRAWARRIARFARFDLLGDARAGGGVDDGVDHLAADHGARGARVQAHELGHPSGHHGGRRCVQSFNRGCRLDSDHVPEGVRSVSDCQESGSVTSSKTMSQCASNSSNRRCSSAAKRS